MIEIDLLVSGDYVLPMDTECSVIKDGAVAVRDGKIVAVGCRKDLIDMYSAKKELGGLYRAVLPGFVNAHTHLPMAYFRGMADDIPLKLWLEGHIWPTENAWLDDDFCYDASLLACLEMLKAGVTVYNNMYFFGDAIARATKRIGMRGVVGAGIVDFPTKTASSSVECLSNAEDLLKTWTGDDLIVPSVAPHSLYTCAPESFSSARKLAERYGAPLHIHLSETRWEVEEIRRRYGKTPIELLDSIGFLSERVLAAHCVWPLESEIEILAKCNVAVAHCIESNMKLASGIAPVIDMLKAGVRVALGTDGAASNNDMSILSEMSTAAKVHKAVSDDPTAMDSRTVLSMATRWGAETLGLGSVTGSLEDGKSADLIVIDLTKPHLIPLYNIYSHLAYSACASDVESVVINGRLVVKDRVLITYDEDKILEKARIWGDKIKMSTLDS